MPRPVEERSRLAEIAEMCVPKRTLQASTPQHSRSGRLLLVKLGPIQPAPITTTSQSTGGAETLTPIDKHARLIQQTFCC